MSYLALAKKVLLGEISELSELSPATAGVVAATETDNSHHSLISPRVSLSVASPGPETARCRLCGAGPSALEIGGHDAAGWRCDACLGWMAARWVPLALPGRDDPLGKCLGCRFIAPLSNRSLCAPCEVERQRSATRRDEVPA
jgi:hypothetical protein